MRDDTNLLDLKRQIEALCERCGITPQQFLAYIQQLRDDGAPYDRGTVEGSGRG